mgnify:CR=1 FL=1
MSLKIKICGLSEPDTVRRAARAGADWLGFVFHPTSPRAITISAAQSLLMHIGPAIPVALLVDPSDERLDEIISIGFPIIQLHGQESPERVKQIKQRTGAEVWKAIPVSTRQDLQKAYLYAGFADRLLLDAKPPQNATRTGGHGMRFDWSLVEDWTYPGGFLSPWLLAGGLRADNLAEAVAKTGAKALDVSSGVETAPGRKSASLIEEFVIKAKTLELR